MIKQCVLPQTRYAKAPNWSQYIFQAKQKPSFVDQHLVWQLCNLWRGMVHEGAPLQVYIRSRKLRNKCRARVWSNTSMQQTSAISYSTKLESEDVRPNLHARMPPKRIVKNIKGSCKHRKPAPLLQELRRPKVMRHISVKQQEVREKLLNLVPTL